MKSYTYSAKTSTRNSVGLIVDEEMKERVVEVIWKNDETYGESNIRA